MVASVNPWTPESLFCTLTWCSPGNGSRAAVRVGASSVSSFGLRRNESSSSAADSACLVSFTCCSLRASASRTCASNWALRSFATCVNSSPPAVPMSTSSAAVVVSFSMSPCSWCCLLASPPTPFAWANCSARVVSSMTAPPVGSSTRMKPICFKICLKSCLLMIPSAPQRSMDSKRASTDTFCASMSRTRSRSFSNRTAGMPSASRRFIMASSWRMVMQLSSSRSMNLNSSTSSWGRISLLISAVKPSALGNCSFNMLSTNMVSSTVQDISRLTLLLLPSKRRQQISW